MSVLVYQHKYRPGQTENQAQSHGILHFSDAAVEARISKQQVDNGDTESKAIKQMIHSKNTDSFHDQRRFVCELYQYTATQKTMKCIVIKRCKRKAITTDHSILLRRHLAPKCVEFYNATQKASSCNQDFSLNGPGFPGPGRLLCQTMYA